MQDIGPGTVIERYRVERVLGAGSMGDVYGAVDIDLKRRVALKILSERHRDNRELRARFVREGRAVAAISHPNVVQVFTTGSYDDRPYIAMEFLDGTDLGTSVKDQGPWTSLQAARAVLDAARGLEAAARAGLIHRDVKPSNLVLLRDGTVKVTDFGLAKPVETDEPALTAMGVVVGTPDYIAPEQARGDVIDERVDIYALGGTLYFLLTGMPPFRTGDPAEDKYLKVVARHLKRPPPDARARSPQADPALCRLVRQMMAKKAMERPGYPQLIEQLGGVVARLEGGGVGQNVDALQGRGPGGQVAPAPLGAAGQSLGSVSVAIGVSAVVSEEPARPGTARWLVAVTVLSALVFVTGLGVLLFGPMPEAPAAEPASAPVDAGVAPRAPDAAAEAPVPPVPAGMILVRRDDGSPWLFVDARPVTHAEYAALFPSHKKPRRREGEPVTRVSHAYAEAYAQAHKKRLLTAEEWQAAARTAGFQGAGELWEWVAGTDGDKRPVRGVKGAAERDARGGKDVTFRLASSL